jgi:SAM-dependent methyltransferase
MVSISRMQRVESSLQPEYADRLASLSGKWWKRWLPNPYRWHIRARCGANVLDVGCGVGRCLGFLGPGRAVGVDPNAASIEIARSRGFSAFTPDEFSEHFADVRNFDTLLCSHVLEHLSAAESEALLREWLPRVVPGGRVVLICPQTRGQASDPTHVRLMDPAALREVCAAVGVEVDRVGSFPLPRWFGRWWVHNETVLVGSVGPRVDA